MWFALRYPRPRGCQGLGIPTETAHPAAKVVNRMDKVAFTGGMRTTGFNPTWPLARLTLTDKGLTLRLVGFALVQSDWAEVASAEHVVGGLMGSPGVRLTLMDGRRFVFWCFRPEAVLAALRDRKVQIIEPDGRPPKVLLGT
jgi:hypothetical protein